MNPDYSFSSRKLVSIYTTLKIFGTRYAVTLLPERWVSLTGLFHRSFLKTLGTMCLQLLGVASRQQCSFHLASWL